MFGVRGLYNFGYQDVVDRYTEELASSGEGKRIDEEEAMEGGLRGRFSAGGEVYFSRKQRSFGSEFCLSLVGSSSFYRLAILYRSFCESNNPRGFTTDNLDTPLQSPDGLPVIGVFSSSISDCCSVDSLRRQRLQLRKRPDNRWRVVDRTRTR